MVDASTPDPFEQNLVPGEPPPEVKRDQYGRYLIPHPDSGKLQAWTRATTFAKTVADMYNIDLYHNRLAVKGMAMRPDLYAEAAAAHVEDKKTLNHISELAMEAAGKSAKARLGTALHAFTEKHDHGEKQDVPQPWDADVKAYAQCLTENEIKVLSRYIEATVVIPKFNVAGTLDRLIELKGSPDPLVGDLKTGHSVEWAWMEIACQLFLYSQASHIYDHRTGELTEFPKVDQERAIVVHLPVGQATASLYEINLDLGGRVAAASNVVRELRKRRDFSTSWESSLTGATARAFAGDDDWDTETAAEATNAGDWDAEMSDTPPKPQPPAKKAAAKKAKDSDVLSVGFVTDDLAEGEIPQEWADLGVKVGGARFQHVKSGKSQYLLVDIQTRGYEVHRLLRNAKSRRTESEDALLENKTVRPIGVDEAGWKPDLTLVKSESEAVEDDWDVEAAGEPPTPTLKTQQPTPVAAEPAPGADDDWDDEAKQEVDAATGLATDDDWDDERDAAEAEAKAAVAPAKDEVARLRAEIARLKGEAPTETTQPAADDLGPDKFSEEAVAPAQTTKPAAKPVKRKWMAEVLEAGSEEELISVYKDARVLGEWNDRLNRAAATRKAELLAQEAKEADDDDDW